MRKKWLLATLASLLLTGMAASAQDVRYNFDQNTEFSKFKTYKWVILADAAALDSLVDKQVRDAIDNELATKGLTRIEDDNADLFIGYQATIDKEKEFTSFSSGDLGYWGYGSGWYRGGWYGTSGTMTTTTQSSTIYVGQLVVDIYDSGGQSLVWRGIASKTLDMNAKPGKRQKNLVKAMRKLFKNFPPKDKS